jgi:hypothetical protein
MFSGERQSCRDTTSLGLSDVAYVTFEMQTRSVLTRRQKGEACDGAARLFRRLQTKRRRPFVQVRRYRELAKFAE